MARSTALRWCTLLAAPTLLAAWCDPGGGGGGTGGAAGVGGAIGGAAGVGGAGAGGSAAGGTGASGGTGGSGAQGGGGMDAGSDSSVDGGGAGGTDSGTGATGGGGTGGAPSCNSVSCGDGCRDPLLEECDDGNESDLDACSTGCQVLDQLTTGAASRVPRRLGEGRTPVAASSSGFAVVQVETALIPPTIGVSVFGPLGQALDHQLLSEGSQPVTFSSPVIAALPGGRYAAAWTDFEGDGDELGIALKAFDGTAGSPPPSSVSFANEQTDFAQFDPEILWTGSELVVSWVDDSSVSTGQDIWQRRFDEALTPLGPQQAVASTDAAEANVALSMVWGEPVFAWRAAAFDASFNPTETVEVRTDSGLAWSVPVPTGAPVSDRPAVVELDENYLLVAYTYGSDPEGTGVFNTPRLQVALLSALEPGAPYGFFDVQPIVEPYASDATLSQSHPNAVAVGSRVFVSWRSATADVTGEELWLKQLEFDVVEGEPVLSLGSEEIPVPRQDGHITGDQRYPALAAAPHQSGGALVLAWEDYGGGFGPDEGQPDVAVEFVPLPILRLSNGLGGE